MCRFQVNVQKVDKLHSQSQTMSAYTTGLAPHHQLRRHNRLRGCVRLCKLVWFRFFGSDAGNTAFAGQFRGGIIPPGKLLEGVVSPPLQNPKAHTTSRTHCTATVPGFRLGKIGPPATRNS